MLFIPGLGLAGRYTALASGGIYVLTRGRGQGGLLKKLSSGVLSLYGVVGFMSDVLSYSRLLALGLATGVIGIVVNTISRMMGKGLFSIVFMIVVLVGGHTFNLLINILGAVVHSSRLQFVEFFGKFYEGGGKSFSPFKITTKYTEVEN